MDGLWRVGCGGWAMADRLWWMGSGGLECGCACVCVVRLSITEKLQAVQRITVNTGVMTTRRREHPTAIAISKAGQLSTLSAVGPLILSGGYTRELNCHIQGINVSSGVYRISQRGRPGGGWGGRLGDKSSHPCYYVAAQL